MEVMILQSPFVYDGSELDLLPAEGDETLTALLLTISRPLSC